MDNAVDEHISADRMLLIEDGIFCIACNSVVVPEPYNPNYLMCDTRCRERLLEGSKMPDEWIHTIVYHTKGDYYAREKEIKSKTTA